MSVPAPGPSRTAVVTGASSGIGIELARQLAGRGWHVTLVARREQILNDVAAEIRAEGGEAETIVADLGDPASREALLAELARRGRTVAILANNAGGSTMGPIWEAEPAAELAMVRTNVEAVVHLCSALVPAMVREGSGLVINVASTAAFQPIPGQAGYAATKAFVLSYSQALHSEVGSRGVTVTALCPGPVETGFAEAAGFDPEQARKAIPDMMWLSAADVARAAIAGAFAGKRVVIPGRANAATAFFAQHSPRKLVLALLRRQHPAMKPDADK